MKSHPCQTCRVGHLKCDNVQPVCGTCKQRGRECIPGYNVRFRRRKDSLAADAGHHNKGKLRFRDNQTWVNAPKELVFVDQNQTASTSICAVPSPSRSPSQFSASLPRLDSPDLPESSNLSPRLEPRREIGEETSPLSFQTLQHVARSSFRLSDYDNSSPESARVVETPRQIGEWRFAESLDISPAISSYPESSTLSVLQPGHEMRNPECFALLHYFRVSIGWAWFDVTDPGLTAEILARALEYPYLLYATLAAACIHQARQSSKEASAGELFEKAEMFHDKCVSLILPMLQDPESITSGIFLACSTILRFYEEMRAPVRDRDDSQHLLGGYACIGELRNRNVTLDSLSIACLWIHQRQDIAVAVANHRCPRTELRNICQFRSGGLTDSYTWTKRAASLHADVIEFCFGPDTHSANSYTSLHKDLEDWYRRRSGAFEQVYFEERSPSHGRWFPSLYYAVDHCSIAMAYYFFSMLLLAIYDPTVPKLGPRASIAQKASIDTARHYLRYLCGLAVSNPVPPARTVVCSAITQCGDWFEEPHEQRAVLDLLQATDDAWPTADIQRTLLRQWEEI